MKNRNQSKGLLAKKLRDPEYRKLHEERYAAFKIEAQILLALEKKGWSYSDLANATDTYKSNISRDLKAGGILSASFSRINKIAEALGMKLIALLVPIEHVQYILPKFEELIRTTSSIASQEGKILTPMTLPAHPFQESFPNSSGENYAFNFQNTWAGNIPIPALGG